ncbi:PREDICTED: protein Wnt-1-like isoform X1 [Priapulus caudatus]|uniref:Protein Wnt n=1 Tax=Priapulus caudatus TaxID=37621 RepID=A0ABM1F9D1_PRICU|nr:PREDICTED: protein Wnt-1-like isoform X1 [Priapulus caudatus]
MLYAKLSSIFVLLLMCCVPQAVVTAKRHRGSKWWLIHRGVVNAGAPSNNVLVNAKGDPVFLDARQQPFNRRQRRLVRKNAGSLVAIAKGTQRAINECKHQFKERRWNCPTYDGDHGKATFGNILRKGCRETAFIYAITSAGVGHTIARACSEGSIQTCTCDYSKRGPSGRDWEWGGCSDNVQFGYKFSRRFVDAAEKGKDIRYKMNLHNNNAGRLHVNTEMRQECKCHGMSGSCTVKTCWMRLPSFREVGTLLKDRFDGASRVTIGNRGNSNRAPRGKLKFEMETYNKNHKPPTRRDLVYIDNSPDFCAVDPTSGSEGTLGRQCNATSIGVDGCDLMCCGRGYRSEEREVVERCSCTFHWCCQVKCEICRSKKMVHTCL